MISIMFILKWQLIIHFSSFIKFDNFLLIKWWVYIFEKNSSKFCFQSDIWNSLVMLIKCNYTNNSSINWKKCSENNFIQLWSLTVLLKFIEKFIEWFHAILFFSSVCWSSDLVIHINILYIYYEYTNILL